MKYVALLSGGKDSCYNLLHCQKNGHELVAAASLGPERGKEELDSYLYQTVGQDAIEFVARALEVPLYRRVISGGSIEQGSEYGSRNAKNAGGVPGDETEDLYELLSSVKLGHPEIKGVSVGAILSNYQRVRVEHVCRRLNLTALSYLWQRDQGELLSEMIESGMQAILIKVAGIGLTTKHLGKTLAEMQPTLVKLNNLYGSHICGEGGEYESLTLDCALFKHRIRITEVETVVHSDHSFATVAFLRIKNAILERKQQSQSSNVSVPQLLDDYPKAVMDAIRLFEPGSISSVSVIGQELSKSQPPKGLGASSKRRGRWIAVADICWDTSKNDTNVPIEEEVRQCFLQLQDELAKYSLELSHCTNINIFISSMDLFIRMNAIYSSFFGASPPTRACVAVDLPQNIRVKLDCIAFSEDKASDRNALHVQGLSYWAPANIGPYSQAISVGENVYISGQIGLIPSSMTLPSPSSIAVETALVCQHVERVTDVLKNNAGGGWVGHTQVALYWLADYSQLAHIKRGHEAYEEVTGILMVPSLFLIVKALPKDALVEKQVLLHTGRCVVKDDDGEDILQAHGPLKVQCYASQEFHWETSQLDARVPSCTVVSVRNGDPGQVSKSLLSAEALSKVWTSALSIRLFYVPSRESTDSF